MPYVRRGEDGRIIAVSDAPLDAAAEEISPASAELQTFVQGLVGQGDVFEASDLKLIQAIEDVIDLLITKNVICITDLPPAVQSKLMERRSLRHSLNALKLFGDDDQGIL